MSDSLRRTWSIATLLILGVLCLPCCNGNSADVRESQQVGEQQRVYADTQPAPRFNWSQDRDSLIQIYKLKNEARVTHSVVRAQGTGEILWDCPSVGFPIPADTQLTNPQQVTNADSSVSCECRNVIEQAEPNGLFSSKNTDGTYVLCVLDDGTISPQYTEDKVSAFTRPIKIVDGRVSFTDGTPTMVIDRKSPPK